jgi:hypothetical protein
MVDNVNCKCTHQISKSDGLPGGEEVTPHLEQGEKIMKRNLSLLVLAVLTFILSGCAMNSGKSYEGEKVKCPACGYEFNVPSQA